MSLQVLTRKTWEREDVEDEPLREAEDDAHDRETQDWGGRGKLDENGIRSPDFLSESESMDHSSGSDRWDVESPSPSKMGRIQKCSDDPISDDDSLIEIELPDGHYVGPKEQHKSRQTPNLLEMLPGSISRQQDIMELLSEINEMNEEENLIEIDISMGSIKCSRLEIEA
ncbi:PREDICTED: uncharacterized protein LOC104594246 [Nelumbo nucifera]|uniref:Uncharacterized protein n=2 Tax=Nelumbo nucifera TaxID=4432 RepID=A0A822XTK8_NELNU|nr:PREDICTED: uncharacterized protein LOC104594246 [Nelumbo nucifera]DAD23657.1 TPA_asm: hypothetical protein HUJ06_025120 [Nelumbo nucifera]